MQRLRTGYRGLAAGIALAALLLQACGGGSAPQDAATTSAAPQTMAAAPRQVTAAPANVADLFPPGDGREPVVNSCGSCHNLACAVIGQRTSARWDTLKTSHGDKVTGVDLDVAFNYLKSHFNDSQPEPAVPPDFLNGGCTPF
jgi:cytochrome c5